MLQQRDDEPLEKLLKPEEAWTALRISRPTFYRCVKDGSLRVVRMRSAILVPESSVREALKKLPGFGHDHCRPEQVFPKH